MDGSKTVAKKETKVDTPNEIIAKAIIQTVELNGVTETDIKKAVITGIGNYLEYNKKSIDESVMKIAMTKIDTPTVIKYDVPEGGQRAILAHKQFDELAKVVASGIPSLMVGMPGTGKTTAAEQVADYFDLPFHSISVGIQTTKSDIVGFVDAGGKYQATGFRKAFEEGGIFLMDEVDAGNPNVLIVVNSALSNGFCSFPDGMVKAHKNFKFVSTANTFGTGADSKFIGRNQLDEATLDRFIVIEWSIDEDVEYGITNDKEWLLKVRALRKAVKDHGRDVLVSPRVSIYGSKLLEAGFEIGAVAKMTILKGKDKETQQWIKNIMQIT